MPFAVRMLAVSRNINRSPVCSCLQGFEPKSPRDWSFLDWSAGCSRRTLLGCDKGDGFLKHKGVKLPDTTQAALDLRDVGNCALKTKNCSCTAYANSDVRGGGSGCILWFGDLIDIREFSDGGQDLYIRVAASELGRVLGLKEAPMTRSYWKSFLAPLFS
uniref:Apple domain-containing protein n=1 Tax=Salix viminalis TaxID=40686 RepID=A0A6N2NJ69_SALVM